MVNRTIKFAIFGVTAFLILCMLSIQMVTLISLNSIEQKNQELTTNLLIDSTDAIKELTQEVKRLETENANMRKQLQLPPSSPKVPPELPNNVLLEPTKTTQFLVIGTSLLIIVLGSINFFIMVIYPRSARKKLEAETKRIQKKAYTEGFLDAPKKLIQDTDVLSNILQWLWRYSKGKAKIEDAATFQKQLLMRMITCYRLRPIGEIGQVVPYNPDTYSTYDRVSVGEEVIITESGWRIGGELVKLPVVSRRSDNG